jgi:hypothetical protein
MARKLYFKGEGISEKDIVIGNHDDVHLKAEGHFDLEGLIYCPKYSVTISLKGSGILTLHGICNRVVIRNISGACILDLQDVTIKEISCESVGGSSVVRMSRPRIIGQKNIFGQAQLIFKNEDSRNSFFQPA